MNQAKPPPRLATPTDLGANAAKDIAGALNRCWRTPLRFI